MEKNAGMLKENEGTKTINRNQKTIKGIKIKLISAVIVVTILAVTILTVLITVNTLKETEKTGMQAMEAKGDYIKNIERIEESNEYMEIKQDAEGKNVPVPRGYVGSSVDGENKVSGGYVIYEGAEPVNDENVAQARKDRNQYVWVPVPDVSQMYGIDSNGKMWGKLYDFTTDTGTGIDSTTGAKPYKWSESKGVMKLDSSTTYREPDVVKDYDTPQYFRQCGLRAESALEHLMNLEKEFETSIESIAKYGGFYIGRYETGSLSGEAVVRRMDKDIGEQTWYTMYEKCKKLRGANENVVTSMIFGSQFDRALMWIIESDNGIDKEDVATDSKDWGNYYNVTLQYDNDGDGSGEATKQENIGTRIPAGSSEKTKAKNIYDLAGNVYDWTIEVYGTDCRVLRGGLYVNVSNKTPAGYRTKIEPYTNNDFIGCRAALFIR